MSFPDGDGLGRGKIVRLNDLNPEVTALALGGMPFGVTSTAVTPYNVAATDSYIIMDATAGAKTVNLPAANAGIRRIIIIKKDNTVNAVTINRAGADTIEGAVSKTLNAQFSKVVLVSDGISQWYDEDSGSV